MLAELQLPLALGPVRRAVDELGDDQAVGQAQRRLHRVGQPATARLAHDQPVDDDVDGVLVLLVQRRRLGQRVRLAVHADAAEALGLQVPERLDELALAPADDRREDLEARALGQRQHLVDDLLRRLAGDRAAAARAVRLPRPRPEQAQVVVDLGDRPDGRAGVPAGRLLVDRDRGAEPLDRVDVGLVHLPEELAGVGGQALDVAALPLREDRVEGEARLAGARQPGEDRHRVARQLDGHVAEVVLPGSPDDKSVGHARHGRQPRRRSAGQRARRSSRPAVSRLSRPGRHTRTSRRSGPASRRRSSTSEVSTARARTWRASATTDASTTSGASSRAEQEPGGVRQHLVVGHDEDLLTPQVAREERLPTRSGRATPG